MVKKWYIWEYSGLVLMHSVLHALMYKICIKNQQNVLYSTDVFLLWYFHLHVSAGNPAYAIHIVHSAHKYGPIETTMSLLHFAHKSKQLNTLENYYIQFFPEHNIIGKEQTHKEKSPSIWIKLQPTAVSHWHITSYHHSPPKQSSSG
jgi:hypothetical protein